MAFKLLRELFGSKVYLLFFLGILISFLDVLGITLVIPILDLAFGLALDETGKVVSYLQEFAEELKIEIQYLLLLVFLLKFAVSLTAYLMNVVIRTSFFIKIRELIYHNMIYDSSSTSRLINVYTEQSNRSLQAFLLLGTIINHSTSVVVTAIALCWFNFWATLVILFTALSLYPIFIFLSRKNVRLSKVYNETIFHLTAFATSTVTQRKAIDLSGIANQIISYHNRIHKNLRSNLIKNGTVAAIVKSIREPILLLILFVSITIIKRLVDISISELVAVVLIFYRLVTALIGMNSEIVNSASYSDSYRMVVATANSNSVQKAFSYVSPKNSIRLEKFEIGRDMPLWGAEDLEFLVGNKYLIKGQSGKGKTTLVDSLLGYVSLSSGRISFDGEVASNAFRLDSVFYMPQETYLFDETIRFNISFSNDSANDKDIISTLQTLGLNLYADKLDLKFSSGGENVSGGQRQRLGLARALFSKRDILVLDEPTSALDDVSSKLVVSALKKYWDKKTVFIISHADVFDTEVDEIIRI